MDSYLLDAGFVMHTNKTSFSTAKMEYSLAHTAALGCHIRYLLSYTFKTAFFSFLRLNF